MDEDTRAALARFERRMGNAHGLDQQADDLSAQADALQHQLGNPAPDRLPLDPELTAIEIADLRQRAAALTERADGIQDRLFETPSDAMQQQVEDWAQRRLDDLERGHDRER